MTANTHEISIGGVRLEQDPLGEVAVPAERLYGAQTARAIANFPLSGRTVAEMPALLRALAQVKKAAALTNAAISELPAEIANAIVQACDEVIAGQWREEFAVDVYQGGAGTSTNMNMNEVLANRALEILGKPRGSYDIVNPNDHVNKSQSTNDAYATAVRLAVHRSNARLVAALRKLAKAMSGKAAELAPIAKLGRTQLQDAVPMSLGQEFGAFGTTLQEDAERADELASLFLEVNLGGTAIGTSVGASAAYGAHIVERLREVTGLDVVRATNLIEATWDMGAFVLYSGMLKRIASKLSKIANDLRLLASGPRGGFAEIRLPRRQPGSSLMPGKVNPVIRRGGGPVAAQRLRTVDRMVDSRIRRAARRRHGRVRRALYRRHRSGRRNVSSPSRREHGARDGARTARRLCTCGRVGQIRACARDGSANRGVVQGTRARGRHRPSRCNTRCGTLAFMKASSTPLLRKPRWEASVATRPIADLLPIENYSSDSADLPQGSRWSNSSVYWSRRRRFGETFQ
jgi:aspartate ammonia-lyase